MFGPRGLPRERCRRKKGDRPRWVVPSVGGDSHERPSPLACRPCQARRLPRGARLPVPVWVVERKSRETGFVRRRWKLDPVPSSPNTLTSETEDLAIRALSPRSGTSTTDGPQPHSPHRWFFRALLTPTHRVPPGLRGPRRRPAPSRSRPPLHPEEDPLHRPLDRRRHGQPLHHHPRRGQRTDSARHDYQIQADRRGHGPRPVLHPGERPRVLLPRASGRPGGRSCRNAGGRRRGRTAKYIPMISWKMWSGRWFRWRARELRASRGPTRCRREKAPTGAESARGSGGPQEWRRALAANGATYT